MSGRRSAELADGALTGAAHGIRFRTLAPLVQTTPWASVGRPRPPQDFTNPVVPRIWLFPLPARLLLASSAVSRLPDRKSAAISSSRPPVTFATGSTRRWCTSARGHALIQNLRRGHYELAVDATPVFRLTTAFDELRPAI